MRTPLRQCLLYLLLCLPASAQVNLDALRGQMMGKTLFLSNFSADPTVEVAWDGSAINYSEPLFHAFMAAKVTGISQRGRVLTIDGERFSLVQNTKTQRLTPTSSVSPMKILVHLTQPDASVDGLFAVLFYSSLQKAISAVPGNMSGVIPGWDPDAKKYAPCDKCPPLFPKSKDAPPNLDSGGTWVAPRLIHSSDPDFPSGPMVAGQVLVEVIVSDHGEPHSLWIVESMGAAYDASAAKSVANYRFKPATKDGIPTAVLLEVLVNFKPGVH